MTEIVLGLGSNLGDRKLALRQAIDLLAQRNIIGDVIISNLYESQALLPDDAPPEWDIKYLNLAVKGKTTLEPQLLLKEIKNIEQLMGRTYVARWAPRIIDIDILAYGQLKINLVDLVIPHVGLLDRAFAAIPFAEIWSNWCYDGKTISQWSQAIDIDDHFKMIKF